MLNWENSKIQLSNELMQIMVQICIPNLSLGFDESAQKKFNLNKLNQSKLAALFMEKGFQPFPFPEQILIVYRNREKQIPKYLLTAWKVMETIFPVQVIVAKEVNDKGVVTLKSTSKELSSKAIYLNGAQLGVSVYPTISYNQKEHKDHLENMEIVYADEVASWYAAFLAHQFSSWSSQEMATLSAILRTEVEVVEDSESKEHSSTFAKDNAEYSYEWSSRFWYGRSGSRQAMSLVSTLNQACTSKFAMLSLITKCASNRFTGSIEREANNLPNLWERDPNYGVTWELDNPTRIICEDSRLPIGFVERDKDQILNVFPFVLPVNQKHSPEMLKEIIATEGDGICDKYNIKFSAGSSASRASGTAMVTEEDGSQIKRSVHDQKGTKALNRPMQARKFLAAESSIEREDGTSSSRQRSVFRIVM